MKLTLSTVFVCLTLVSTSTADTTNDHVHDAVHELFKQQVLVGDSIDFVLPTFKDRKLQEINTSTCNKKTFQITDSYYTDDNIIHAMNHNGESIHLVKTKGIDGHTDFIVGSIVSPLDDIVYEIYVDHMGKSQIRATNSADFRPETDAEDEDEENNADMDSDKSIDESSSDVAPIQATDTSKTVSLRGHDPSRRLQAIIMDVMVAWTPYAECKNSGQGAGCAITSTTTSNIQAKIALAISETNQIYSNTGINAKMRLVYSYRLDGYTESSVTTTLKQATQPSDGIIDDIHTNRATYGADLVSVWIVDSQSCGQANYNYPTTRSSKAFSVVAYDCATGYYSFGHEIGHNMGCQHDRGSLNQCTATTSNFGYKSHTVKRRDVMAVDCQTGQCDNCPYSSCARVPVYSTTATTPYGTMGDAQNNCAAVINSNVPVVANFYSTVVP